MISNADILGAKILIVDDLETNVLLLQKILDAAGYSSVNSTMDPTQVCALHRDNGYDLILLDLMMPVMDGFEVLEGLKQIDPGNYVPVLVVTAQPNHKLRALQAGAKDFISKPFNVVEVKTRIHNALEVRLCLKQLAEYNQRLEKTVLERTAALRQSEERFQRLTELSSDWYWEQDAHGKFTKLSGPALEMLGIRGDGSPDVGSTGWDEVQRATLDANIARRRPFLDFVYSRTHADGRQQTFQVSGEPIFSSSGNYAGYRGIGTDISRRQ